MGTFTNEEVLEDGTKKISTYDDKTHKLLGYHHVNAKGKKHGEEVEYDSQGEINAERTYENGVCKKSKEKVPFAQIREFLVQSTLDISLLDKYFGTKKATVTKEDGQYKHIRIDGDKHDYANRSSYVRTYDMEFRNGKEYGGYFKVEEPDIEDIGYLYARKPDMEYKYKDGCLDGDFLINEQEGKYIEGKFSGKKYVSMEDSPCTQFIRDNTDYGRKDEHCINCKKSKFYQVFENGEFVSDNAVVQVNNAPSWLVYQPIYAHIPVNGTAKIIKGEDTVYSVEVKDGKKNGQFCDSGSNKIGYFTDDKLNGTTISYYDEQMQMKKEEISYKNGELDGVYVEYFKPTKKQTDKHDKKTIKKMALALSQGKEITLESVIGNKKVEGFYKEGKKNGVWKYYSEDGNVIKTEFWNQGKDETLKYAAMKKVAAKYVDEAEPTTKIGKAVTKAMKTVEILKEVQKLKKQND